MAGGLTELQRSDLVLEAHESALDGVGDGFKMNEGMKGEVTSSVGSSLPTLL